MDLFEETERLKLRLIAAYEKLHKQGRLTEAELESVLDLIDRLEDLPEEEVQRRLESLEKGTTNQ